MRFRLDLRYSDYDAKGHVNNATFLTYFEIARHRAWIETLGQDPELPFILAEATVRFVSQARPDEPLDIEISTAEVRTRSWVFAYRVLDARGGRLVAEGRTVQVMFDYASRVATPVPDAVRTALLSL